MILDDVIIGRPSTFISSIGSLSLGKGFQLVDALDVQWQASKQSEQAFELWCETFFSRVDIDEAALFDPFSGVSGNKVRGKDRGKVQELYEESRRGSQECSTSRLEHCSDGEPGVRGHCFECSRLEQDDAAAGW